MRHRLMLLGFSSLLLLTAADDAIPNHPKSPKATDAIRLDNAALRKAATVYWLDCETADKKLEQDLKTAADAAHNRNDGTEEQACLDALKDVQARIQIEIGSRNSPPAGLEPLRCEKKSPDKTDSSKKPAG